MVDEEEFNPDWVSPPGSTVLDIIEEQKISKKDFRRVMGMTHKQMNKLLKGYMPITPEIAVKLAGMFDTPISFWMNREKRYRELLKRGGK